MHHFKHGPQKAFAQFINIHPLPRTVTHTHARTHARTHPRTHTHTHTHPHKHTHTHMRFSFCRRGANKSYSLNKRTVNRWIWWCRPEIKVLGPRVCKIDGGTSNKALWTCGVCSILILAIRLAVLWACSAQAYNNSNDHIHHHQRIFYRNMAFLSIALFIRHTRVLNPTTRLLQFAFSRFLAKWRCLRLAAGSTALPISIQIYIHIHIINKIVMIKESTDR